MSLIIPAAIITAIILLYILSPMFGSKEKKIRNKAMVIGCFIAFIIIVTYSFRGYPDLRGSPALFEVSGERFEIRNLMYLEADLKAAYKLNPNNIKIALNLANTKILLGKIKETAELLEEILEKNPDNPAAKYMLKNILDNFKIN